MSQKYTFEAPSDIFVDGVVKDLSRVRQWIAGFEAAGGKGPAHTDALRQAQVLLSQRAKTEDPARWLHESGNLDLAQNEAQSRAAEEQEIPHD